MFAGPTPFFYRPLASPLHAARASVSALWAAALTAAVLLLFHPLALLALLIAVLIAGAGAGVRGPLLRSLRTALIVSVPIVVINVLVSRDGLTVFARLGDLGPFGQGDLTVEALVYGAVIALKVVLVIFVTTLASLTVDPDDLLRGVRRLSFRSALTASLAVRMIPLLAADAQRVAEAQRTRPGGMAAGARARVALLGAVVGGSLDRAMDVAATLELRGFAMAGRPLGGFTGATPGGLRGRFIARRARAPRALGAPVVAPRHRLRLLGGGGARARARGRPGRRGLLPGIPARARAGEREHAGAVRGADDRRAGALLRSPGDRAVKPILSFEHVTYRYPGVASPALDDVSLEVHPGELCLVAGLSGHGKSTLLRAACGLVPHFHGGRFAGRVQLAGLDTREHPPARLGAVAGALFQDPETQLVTSSVRSELALSLESRGHGATAVARGVEEVALALGLDALLDRSIHSLSGGEQQRVALAAALAGRPAGSAARRADLPARSRRGR